MFRLHGFYTQNTLKTLYVLDEIVGDYEYVFVDLSKGENRTDEFRKMTPIGKVPVLEHDGEFLFESGAICRYVANVESSPLYPEDAMQRAKVDQWMDFFSCHLGRWMTKLYFEAVIKPRMALGEPDAAGIEEATRYVRQQLKMLERQLIQQEWLANEALSIADLFAYAYVEQYTDANISLDDYPGVRAWLDRIASRHSIRRARARLPH